MNGSYDRNAMVDLNALASFVRVVDAGGFSAAARGLSLTPSAVSKQISRLEDRLGVRLLQRTTRKLSLTEEGMAYYRRAARVLADAEEAEREIADLRDVPSGKLHVSLPLAFGRKKVVPAMPAFLKAHPEVQLDLNFSDAYVDLIEDGIDVAMRIGELTDSSLIARRVAPNRRVVCAVPAYFERHGRPATPADLARHNCFVYSYRRWRRDWPFLGPDGREILVSVTGSVESNDAEALHGFLMAGLGVALMPLWLVGEELADGRVEEALADYQVPDSAIYAVYPSTRHLAPKVRAFIDFMAERLAACETED